MKTIQPPTPLEQYHIGTYLRMMGREWQQTLTYIKNNPQLGYDLNELAKGYNERHYMAIGQTPKEQLDILRITANSVGGKKYATMRIKQTKELAEQIKNA
jgi:hypothetical protein